MAKKDEVLSFLKEKVFDPILCCPVKHKEIEEGVRRTLAYFETQTARGIVEHYWKSIRGTRGSISFSGMLRQHGFPRFEDVLEEFRMRFNEEWLNS